MGYRVWGIGFGVLSLGYRVWGLGFRVWGFSVQGSLGLRVSGKGCVRRFCKGFCNCFMRVFQRVVLVCLEWFHKGARRVSIFHRCTVGKLHRGL